MVSKGLTWKLDTRVDVIKQFIKFSKTDHSSLTMMQAGTELKAVDLTQVASDGVDLESK